MRVSIALKARCVSLGSLGSAGAVRKLRAMADPLRSPRRSHRRALVSGLDGTIGSRQDREATGPESLRHGMVGLPECESEGTGKLRGSHEGQQPELAARRAGAL